jgi:hypothetical protein
MFSRATAAAALLTAGALSVATPRERTLFSAWASRFNKEYASLDAEASALQAFLVNDALIAQKNEQHLSYTLAQNEFSDMTAKEFYTRGGGWERENSAAAAAAAFFAKQDSRSKGQLGE